MASRARRLNLVCFSLLCLCAALSACGSPASGTDAGSTAPDAKTSGQADVGVVPADAGATDEDTGVFPAGQDAATTATADTGTAATADVGTPPGKDAGIAPDAGGASPDSGLPAIYVAICPKTDTILPNEQIHFSATVVGIAPTTVTWLASSGTIDATGFYIAPPTPGLYNVVATSTADIALSDTALVEVVAAAAHPKISGAITYSGSKTGRLYVRAYPRNCGMASTQDSRTTIGGYALHGVGHCMGNYAMVEAWRDSLGTGVFNYAADPFIFASITFDGTVDVTSNLDLVDPPTQTPGAPTAYELFVGDSGAVVLFNGVYDTNGREMADHYTLYADTSATPDLGHWVSKRTILAGSPAAFMDGLANGTPYYFAVQSFANGTAGGISAALGPATAGIPAGGHTVSGTVNYPGLTPTGPLYAVVYAGGNNGPPTAIYFTKVASPGAGTASYSIGGVPDGTYSLGATIDMSNSGNVSQAGNPSTGFNGGAAGTVTVAGANVTAPAFALATADAVAVATTYHNHSPSNESYSVDLTVSPNLKIVAKATVVSGNGTSPPLDLGPQICTNCGSALRGNVLTTSALTVGDDYVLAVTTDDGRSCNLTAKVTGVITGWAAKTAPASNASSVSLTPDFTWTAPSPAPTGTYSYQLMVWPSTGGNYLWSFTVPSGTTTAHYNSDGKATALVSATQYLWTVRVTDAFGNQSEDSSGQFTTL